MILSIKTDKSSVDIDNLIDNFLKCWEKYLLTIGIEIANIRIKKGD